MFFLFFLGWVDEMFWFLAVYGGCEVLFHGFYCGRRVEVVHILFDVCRLF